MPIFAISLMAIMALVGATIALGMDTRSANNLQLAADASALGGATAFLNSDAPKAEDRLLDAEIQARSLAARNSNFSLSDLAIAAVTEDAYGQHTSLEVELEYEPVNYFAKFAGDSTTVPIRRSATASATWGFPLCILTLAESGTGLHVSGSATLSAQDCIIWSNSNHDWAMLFDGGTSESKAFCAAGKTRELTQASVTPEPETGCQVLPDPLEGFDVEVNGICDNIKLISNRQTSTTLSPGVYCGGITLNARNITFEPGIYIIRDGDLNVNATQDILAEGVTFLFDGALSGVDINGNGGLSMTAPTDGPTAGIAFAQLPGLSTVTGKVLVPQFNVRGKLYAEGVFYLPSFDMNLLAQGDGSTASPYLQLVVNTLSLSDRSALVVEFNEAETDLPIVIQPEKEARLIR